MDLLSSSEIIATCRAHWAAPAAWEAGAPPKRIIHARAVRLPHGSCLSRLGIRRGEGYFKCGSHPIADRLLAARLLIWDDQAWQVLRELRDLPRSETDEVTWIDLGSVQTKAALIECRRSEVDGWWSPWNLAMTGLILEGTAPTEPLPTSSLLSLREINLAKLPSGLIAEQRPGEVRFRSAHLEVGFRLRSPGFSYLSLDEQGRGHTGRNVLCMGSPLEWMMMRPQLCHHAAHGIRLTPVGGTEECGFLQRSISGFTRIDNNTVTYNVQVGIGGQHYELQWEVLPDRLMLHIVRTAPRTSRAWESSAWHIAFDGSVIPPTAIGRITQRGESGLMTLPVLLHWPGMGMLRVDALSGCALLRSDCVRPARTSTIELKLGEVAMPEGDYLLESGRHEATVQFRLADHQVRLSCNAPKPVAQAVQRAVLAGLPYRADTATFSNNGQSIHAPICMDGWAALASRAGTILPGVDAMELMRTSLERWLDRGPGYGSGSASPGNGQLEDEYLMTGAASLAGLADYLAQPATTQWYKRNANAIARELDLMRKRDLDGDGLIESATRSGVSGTGSWSTCWYDVISFGWKDAFSNALLHQALTKLSRALVQFDESVLAEDLRCWADQIKSIYAPTFLNPETGWLAGWRCRENKLHDFAFLFVNGAAVCAGLLAAETANCAIRGLWAEMKALGFDQFTLGLPGNLRPIPPSDVADPQRRLPDDAYQNRGLTHSQSRHFVQAMYQVGMTDEADHLLHQLCTSLADGSAFGGCGSGVDWRRWDGSPCGYEGLLSDQFGILAVAIDRYKRAPDVAPL